MTEDAWNREFWPSGERDAHGNPDLVWPDQQLHPQGFATPESRIPAVLHPGEMFDRYGPGFGQFGSPVGTAFPDRALPPQSLDAGYHRYEVVRPVPIWQGPIAPAMGQPGGGIQYYFPNSIVDLVNAGYLKETQL
ncbi:TNT domain-containing protein [Mycobacterium sp. NPDC003449]